jgi:hypothetical protein
VGAIVVKVHEAQGFYVGAEAWIAKGVSAFLGLPFEVGRDGDVETFAVLFGAGHVTGGARVPAVASMAMRSAMYALKEGFCAACMRAKPRRRRSEGREMVVRDRCMAKVCGVSANYTQGM